MRRRKSANLSMRSKRMITKIIAERYSARKLAGWNGHWQANLCTMEAWLYSFGGGSSWRCVDEARLGVGISHVEVQVCGPVGNINISIAK